MSTTPEPEEAFVVGGKRRREQEDAADPQVVEGIYEHEIYGTREYVSSALDKLWTLLSDGGQITLDMSRNTAEKFVDLYLIERAGMRLPAKVQMTWRRVGDTLRITFPAGEAPQVFFKHLWKSAISVTEITVTRDEAKFFTDSMFVRTQTIIFKPGTP